MISDCKVHEELRFHQAPRATTPGSLEAHSLLGRINEGLQFSLIGIAFLRLTSECPQGARTVTQRCQYEGQPLCYHM